MYLSRVAKEINAQASIRGNTIFVIVLTGSGKSVCFVTLTLVFDHLRCYTLFLPVLLLPPPLLFPPCLFLFLLLLLPLGLSPTAPAEPHHSIIRVQVQPQVPSREGNGERCHHRQCPECKLRLSSKQSLNNTGAHGTRRRHVSPGTGSTPSNCPYEGPGGKV